MTRPIGIVFANFKGNIGDFAIVHAMLLHVQVRHPGQPVHVWPHGFAPIDRDRLAAFRRHAPPFTLKENALFAAAPPGRLTTRLLRATGTLRRHHAGRIARIAARDADAAADFAPYAAIYVAGGAQWTGAVSGVGMLAGLRAIAAHNPRIHGFPVSTSAAIFRLGTAAALGRDLSRLHGPVVTRDSASARLLRGLGLSVVEGADCVFALQHEGAAVAARQDPAPDRVLICVTGQSAADIGAAVDALRAAGRDAALLSTCATEDAPVQAPLAAALGVPFLAPATWQDTVAEMAASGLVVTNRLHGYILGSFTAVPVLPLTDRSKVRAVVADAGLPLWLDRLADLDGGLLGRVQGARASMVALSAAYRRAALDRQITPVAADA